MALSRPTTVGADMHNRLTLAMHKERILSFDLTSPRNDSGNDDDDDDEVMPVLITQKDLTPRGEVTEHKQYVAQLEKILPDRVESPPSALSPTSQAHAESLVERKFREAKRRDEMEAQRSVSRLSKREITSTLLDALVSTSDLDPCRALSSPELKSNVPLLDEDEVDNEDEIPSVVGKPTTNRRKMLDGIMGMLRKRKIPNAA
mmetsp:Transcript_194/g.622  ORF Transcript_194/g.622 Transcript_194/m.622 type:complete len:203 (+) Transcript_194:144-752(+)|eukprot:CAMPEP_0198734904 /NCGR_PEP_ID=MMETSP1475-20131203/55861_1 /TAXON_ID= ORGANISM="Unidentified sp., Strain CCMP1999" /NCGR_SAMPLE_ID=MMETSP1475 /ASSEMBLY_ACC=CAM_ASM_001111 /LENGTH=202 /DNA_ID=CAMNT_0044498467 /DNA_START=116 /DNA_END=724 /DNA_ORIENTATION=-